MRSFRLQDNFQRILLCIPMDTGILVKFHVQHAMSHICLLLTYVLPLDVDSINENDSVANPDPTPRIASVHKSRFAEVVLVGCWMEAVYYCLLLRKR